MARLDFLWQLQARDEKLDMEALQVNFRELFLLKDYHYPSFSSEFQSSDSVQSASCACGNSLSGQPVPEQHGEQSFLTLAKFSQYCNIEYLIILLLYSSLVIHIRKSCKKAFDLTENYSLV